MGTRHLLLAILLSVGTPLLSAPAAAQESAVIGVESDVPTLNGLLADPSQAATWEIIWRLHEPLMDWRDGQPVPALADSVSKLDDQPLYVFQLNASATWHDGTDFTAADVKFSFDRVLDPALGSPYAERVREAIALDTPLESGASGFDAPTDDTFVIRSQGQPDEAFLTAITIPIVPKHIWEAIPVAEWDADPASSGAEPARVVGTGEFKFLRRYQPASCEDIQPERDVTTPDEEIVLEAFPAFGNRSRRWEDPPPSVLHFYVYKCAQGDLDPGLRLLRAGEDRIIDRIADVGVIGVPPEIVAWPEGGPPPDDTPVWVEIVAPEVLDPLILEVIDEGEAGQ